MVIFHSYVKLPEGIIHHSLLKPFSTSQPFCSEALEFLIQFVVQIAEAAFDQTVGDPDLFLASGKMPRIFRSLGPISNSCTV